MDLLRDRRCQDHLPRPGDYEVPVSRESLIEANRRFRRSGVPLAVGYDEAAAQRIINQATKLRFNARHREGMDVPTIGDYLEYLNSQVQ